VIFLHFYLENKEFLRLSVFHNYTVGFFSIFCTENVLIVRNFYSRDIAVFEDKGLQLRIHNDLDLLHRSLLV
jgi:hypothetical protein